MNAAKHESSVFHAEVFRLVDLKKVLAVPTAGHPESFENFGGIQVKRQQLNDDFELQLLSNLMELVKVSPQQPGSQMPTSEMAASQVQVVPQSSRSYVGGVANARGVNLASYPVKVGSIQAIKSDDLVELAKKVDQKRNAIITNQDNQIKNAEVYKGIV